MGVACIQKCVYEDGALPDVDMEGLSRPVAHTLNYRGRGAVFGERCRATCAHGLAGDVCVKELSNLFDEKRAGGYQPVGSEPERGG